MLDVVMPCCSLDCSMDELYNLQTIFLLLSSSSSSTTPARQVDKNQQPDNTLSASLLANASVPSTKQVTPSTSSSFMFYSGKSIYFHLLCMINIFISEYYHSRLFWSEYYEQ